MTTRKTAVLETVAPILQVADLMRAFEFYGRVLGFQIGWKWGDPPRLASVFRDRIELHLALSAGPQQEVSRAYFRMTGVDAYFEQVTQAGAKIVMPIADRPYGMRDFRVADEDGNELSFGEAA